MDDSNVPIFAQAKLEYTKQLVDVLYMNMYDGIRSIYDDSKKLYAQKTTSIIYIFRSLLEKVPTWNTDIIEAETLRIMKTSKCDWLDDLLTAVFISHTRILMSIGPNQNYNKINVTIPKTATFIHKSYVNIAREVWKNPYLFSEQVPGHEYQRNMKQLEDMIKLTIEDTIRRQLPIKEILKEHLETYDDHKQTSNKPIDMHMIMNEIRKAASHTNSRDSVGDDESDEDQEGKEAEEANEVLEVQEDMGHEGLPNTGTEGHVPPSLPSPPSPSPPSAPDGSTDYGGIPINSNDIIFSKEEDSVVVDTAIDKSDIKNTSLDNISEPPVVSIYKDPNDPDETQIQKATQNIIVNDITEPVVEGKYDNTDIVDNTISTTNKEEVATKLNEMLKDLDKSLPKETKIDNTLKPVTDTTFKPVNTIKPVTTIKPKDSSATSVIKIDAISSVPRPDVEVKKVEEVTPFSFSNLYPNLVGSGKVEDITNKSSEIESKTDSNKDIKDVNASIMKEIISLDKKEDTMDETATLDNFFTDVKKLTNSMDPIKEETKYTLFEDAPEKDS